MAPNISITANKSLPSEYVSLATLWHLCPCTISGAICTYFFLCNSCFAGDSNFNGFGLVSHRAFPKSMITGLYASPCLSVSTLLDFRSLCRKRTSWILASASVMPFITLNQQLLPNVSFLMAFLFVLFCETLILLPVKLCNQAIWWCLSRDSKQEW